MGCDQEGRGQQAVSVGPHGGEPRPEHLRQDGVHQDQRVVGVVVLHDVPYLVRPVAAQARCPVGVDVRVAVAADVVVG